MGSQGFSTLSSSMRAAGNYTRWVLDAFAPFVGRRVMEVGLGHGDYVAWLSRGEDYLGVDSDDAVVGSVARLHPEAEFKVSDISKPGFVDDLGGRRFDTVICVNVLEHIEDDSSAVRNLLGVLHDGGHLLLFVPALQGLYTDLDRLAGHVRRYTRRRLVQAFPTQGVTVRRLEYFNPIGAMGWWMQRFLSHETLESRTVSVQVEIFDRYVLPLSRRFNLLTKRWFGQSVLAVVRKG